MYSKMLRYIIACCIISLCNSAPDEVGSYKELVLVQHLSRSHGWIILGLWGKLENRLLTNCKDSNNKPLKCDHNSLSTTVKYDLGKNWPSVAIRPTNQALWESEYNVFGSCIEKSPTNYFSMALELFNDHNAGNILNSAGIYEGDSYSHDHIVQAIKDDQNAVVYLRCVQDKKSKKQHLASIAVCLNVEHQLIDCTLKHSGNNARERCDTKKNIYYPTSSETSDEELIKSYASSSS